MTNSFRIDRRAFLKGLGGATLALPVLEVMGAEVTDRLPRRLRLWSPPEQSSSLRQRSSSLRQRSSWLQRLWSRRPVSSPLSWHRFHKPPRRVTERPTRRRLLAYAIYSSCFPQS